MRRLLVFLVLVTLGSMFVVGVPDVQLGDADDLTAMGEASLAVVAAAPALAPAPSARFTPVHSDERPPRAPAAVPPYRPPRSA